MICPRCGTNVKPLKSTNQCPLCWADMGDHEPRISDVLAGALIAGLVCWAVIYEAIKYFTN